MLMILIFWTSLGVLLYTYVGYGLLVIAASRWFGRDVERDEKFRTVTVIIAAFNEEKHIADKVSNVLSLDYPSDRINIVVGSDASTDETDNIVRAIGDPRVFLRRVKGRLGKTAVQNICAEEAEGEILVFTDSTTVLHNQSLRRLVSYFADDGVTCAGARLVYRSDTAGQTERGGVAYWSYEATLKQAESDLNSLIGVSGCYYAVRRDRYKPIAPALISDFVIALDVVSRRERVVYAADAVCEEETLVDSSEEFSMRVRVIVRSLAAISARKHLLNPFLFPLFSIQLWSHKVLRYLAWFPLVLLFAASIILAGPDIYGLALTGQILVYGLAILGLVLNKLSVAVGILAIPYYFCLANAAAFWGTVQFLRGRRVTVWTPRR